MHRQIALAALLLLPSSLHAGPVANDQRETVSTAIEKLKDADLSVRADAARQIRQILRTTPGAANDVGEAYWRKKFEAIKSGMTSSDIKKALGITTDFGPDSGPCSGQSCTVSLRLDNYWSAILFFSSQTKGLLGVSKLIRGARYFWVDPPKNYSGKWLTYYVNGLPSHEIEYSGGHYVRFRALHDNGLTSYVQQYPNGRIDGPEIGRYPNGGRKYEGQYRAGKRAGRWIHWYESGQKQYEFEYDENGKEVGQAAWNLDGSVQFVTGSLSHQK